MVSHTEFAIVQLVFLSPHVDILYEKNDRSDLSSPPPRNRSPALSETQKRGGAEVWLSDVMMGMRFEQMVPWFSK